MDLKHIDSLVTVVPVERLKLSHVPRAANTCVDAFHNDPHYRYLAETPDASSQPLRAMRNWYRILISIQIVDAVIMTTNWSVHGGESIAMYSNPAILPTPVQWMWTTAMKVVAKLLRWCLYTFLSSEQNARLAESESKMHVAVEDAFGQRAKEMICLNILATAPESQGHGYASALVSTVTAEADSQGRATWLMSSNITNTAFYESLGFTAFREIVLGNGNSTWREPPVVILLMVREFSTLDQKVSCLDSYV